MWKIVGKFNKLKNMPFNIIMKKSINRINSDIHYKYRKIMIKKNPIDMENRYFEGFEPRCNFIFDSNNKQYYINNLLNLHVQNNIISDADKIVNHIFNILGSGDTNLGDKLPWNKDFKSGFVWGNNFYKNIRIVDLSNNSDVKIPWELSRFQHIFTLGKTYWLTDDDKYALEFKYEIEDWIDKNPIEMSVNWTCTMDVAIRAVNLIVGYFFFKDCTAIDKGFWCSFNKSLYLHGRFIFNNLENKGEISGNHYLSDIVGLIWLGVYFSEFIICDREESNNPQSWLSFGIKELEKEMFVQVNEDGTDYEASTSYHRLVTEMLLVTTILCEKNLIYFSKEYMNKLEKMCEFIMDITKPNGLSPLIGDGDDGRLLIISNYSKWVISDFRHLLSSAGEFFNRDDFRYYGRDFIEDALWVMGLCGEDVTAPSILKSKEYRNGGYYILRNDRVYCLIRCGQLSGRGQGGHSHNDQLSFELNVNGEDFIVDPGTYLYTGDYKMRNLFRSTAHHNTLYVSGYEQNDFDECNLFEMREQCFGECIEFDSDRFVGRHYGYEKKLGIVHERSIRITKASIYIIDRILSKNQSGLTVKYFLNKGVQVIKNDNILTLTKKRVQIIIRLPKYINCHITNGLVSKGYGESSSTYIIEINCAYNTLDLCFEIKL